MPLDPRADADALHPQGGNDNANRRYGFAARQGYEFENADLSNIEMPSHWAVPWADLMMVMMVMFAVMLATNLAERDVSELFKKDTNAQPKQHAQPAPKKNTETQATPNAQSITEPKMPVAGQPKADDHADTTENTNTQTVAEKSENAPIPIQDILRLSKNLVTEANLNDIDVVLTDNQSIKVSVRGNLLFDLGKADLKPEAISFLDQLSQIIAGNNYQIEVAGHTDNFPVSNPAYPTNWELSSARAARVARYLIQHGRLEPGRFTVLGHSFYQPTVPNDSLANKAKNRRVEIIITRYEYKPDAQNHE
jgi:chemotaxis protein MotB